MISAPTKYTSSMLMKFIFPFCLGLIVHTASALEVQGFLTKSCEKRVGIIVYATDETVELIDLEGHLQTLATSNISSIMVYDVLESPIPVFHIDEAARARLKSLRVDDQGANATDVFAIRFIEDLLIFISLDGKTHVHSYADIHSLRPVNADANGPHSSKVSRLFDFDFSGAVSSCPQANVDTSGIKKSRTEVKPTRIMTDPISVSEFLNSFAQGYEGLESFQERTYLYAKPYLFQKRARFGVAVVGSRNEPAIPVPIYFQFASGEAYRFQSFTQFGMVNQEFSPNSEPVFSFRTEAKSHLFHALFLANVAGIPAGNSIFLKNPDLMKLTQNVTVQPAFNYLAMMGADYGPYTLSIGFYYPTFGIRIKDEYREVLGSSVSYALRVMYTTNKLRLRAIGSWSKYNQAKASQSDVLAKTGESGQLDAPTSFQFQSLFLRSGVDYEFSEGLKCSIDGILVNGSYKELRSSFNNDVRFTRFTTQFTVRQSFSEYLSVSASANLYAYSTSGNFLNVGLSEDKQESNFFGSFEFVF